MQSMQDVGILRITCPYRRIRRARLLQYKNTPPRTKRAIVGLVHVHRNTLQIYTIDGRCGHHKLTCFKNLDSTKQHPYRHSDKQHPQNKQKHFSIFSIGILLAESMPVQTKLEETQIEQCVLRESVTPLIDVFRTTVVCAAITKTSLSQETL